MNEKKQVSDVDFIGGQEPLTAEEEKALSEFFRKRKLAEKKTAEKRGAPEKSTFRQAPKL